MYSYILKFYAESDQIRLLAQEANLSESARRALSYLDQVVKEEVSLTGVAVRGDIGRWRIQNAEDAVRRATGAVLPRALRL